MIDWAALVARVPELVILCVLVRMFLRYIRTRDQYVGELHERSLDVIDKNTATWAEVKEALHSLKDQS